MDWCSCHVLKSDRARAGGVGEEGGGMCVGSVDESVCEQRGVGGEGPSYSFLLGNSVLHIFLWEYGPKVD